MDEHVNTVRGIARWVLRSLALGLAAMGIYLLLKRVAFAMVVQDASVAFMAWDGIGASHEPARGAAMLLLATILAVAGDPLVRWAIPMPPRGCPRCGHGADDAATPTDGRCPECGLRRAGPASGPASAPASAPARAPAGPGD